MSLSLAALHALSEIRLLLCIQIGRAALKCQVCDEPLYNSRKPDRNVSVFFCGHAYHELCLLRRCAKHDSGTVLLCCTPPSVFGLSLSHFAFALAAATGHRNRSHSTASRDAHGRVGRGGYGVSSSLQQSSFGSPSSGSKAGGRRRSIASSIGSEDDGPSGAGRSRAMSRGSIASASEFDDADMERLYCTICANSGGGEG